MTRPEIIEHLEAHVCGLQVCVICGGENDDAHDSLPHCFEAVDMTSVLIAAADELRRIGVGQQND